TGSLFLGPCVMSTELGRKYCEPTVTLPKRPPVIRPAETWPVERLVVSEAADTGTNIVAARMAAATKAVADARAEIDTSLIMAISVEIKQLGTDPQWLKYAIHSICRASGGPGS